MVLMAGSLEPQRKVRSIWKGGTKHPFGCQSREVSKLAVSKELPLARAPERPQFLPPLPLLCAPSKPGEWRVCLGEGREGAGARLREN